ncbi:hypothetical protein N665_0036s0083 [Sinapis alba]|nr:hypothetical protein N665_0036s0083 [Sinapis alba]
MNPRHNEIAPLNTSFANSTRSPPPPPPSNGGGESGTRGGTPRVRGRRSSSRPNILPYPQFPPTHRPPMGLPMYQPSPPVFPFGSLPPMSPAPSWLPYYTPAPVANYDALRPSTFAEFCGRAPPRNAHRKRKSVKTSRLSSQRPQSAERVMSPKPIEMPVGVMPNEGPGEAEDVMNVLLTDYMDPDKIFYVYSEDDLKIVLGDSENVKSSSNLNGHESPNLSPSQGNHHGVTKWVDENKNALSDPKNAKRILANGESSARSSAKKVRPVQDLEENVSAFGCEADVSTGNPKLKERSLSVLEDENKELRIGENGLQEQLSRRNALDEQLIVEDLHMELASGEFMFDSIGYDMSNWELLDANMFQTFDPSMKLRSGLGKSCRFKAGLKS